MELYHQWLAQGSRDRRAILQNLGRRLSLVGFWTGLLLMLLGGLAMFALTACRGLR